MPEGTEYQNSILGESSRTSYVPYAHVLDTSISPHITNITHMTQMTLHVTCYRRWNCYKYSGMHSQMHQACFDSDYKLEIVP